MRKTIVIGLVGAAIAAWAWDAAAEAASGRVERARAAAQLNTIRIRMALEQYGTDHAGRYPRDHEVAAALARDNYLPGNRLGAGYRLVADAVALAHPERAPAYAPGTFVYHCAPGPGVYQLRGVGPDGWTGRP